MTHCKNCGTIIFGGDVMRGKAQKFDPRQNMNAKDFEIFHYLDIKTRHMDSHFHDFYEVFMFVNGDVDYWIDGSVYHLEPGDILLINPTQLHKPIPRANTENYERIVLWINKEFLENQAERLDVCFDENLKTYKKIMRPTKSERQEITPLFEQMIREYYSKNFGAKTVCYGLFLQIMANLNRISLGGGAVSQDEYQTPTLITEVLAYIGEHYNENISLDLLSKHFFVSKYYLSHEFSKSVGTSIYKYLTLKRLIEAKKMLCEGVSPGEVAIKCGFKDYTNFFRAFKSEYGVSPRNI